MAALMNVIRSDDGGPFPEPVSLGSSEPCSGLLDSITVNVENLNAVLERISFIIFLIS
jgi:hypothetical protein